MNLPTLAEVARLAGVSQSTASRVLSGSTRPVRAQSRERVEEVARLLGYTPDLSARAMVTRSSQLVIVISQGPVCGDTVAAVTEIARGIERSGWTVLTAFASQEEGDCRKRVMALRGYRPRAVLILANDVGDGRDVGESGIPVVLDEEDGGPPLIAVSASAIRDAVSRHGADAAIDHLAARLQLLR